MTLSKVSWRTPLGLRGYQKNKQLVVVVVFTPNQPVRLYKVRGDIKRVNRLETKHSWPTKGAETTGKSVVSERVLKSGEVKDLSQKPRSQTNKQTKTKAKTNIY